MGGSVHHHRHHLILVLVHVFWLGVFWAKAVPLSDTITAITSSSSSSHSSSIFSSLSALSTVNASCSAPAASVPSTKSVTNVPSAIRASLTSFPGRPATHTGSETQTLASTVPPPEPNPHLPAVSNAQTPTKIIGQAPNDKRDPGDNPIRPEMFYLEGRLKVKCRAIREIYNLNPHGNQGSVPLEDWPNWRALGPREEIYEMIRTRREACLACRCDDNGALIARYAVHLRGKGPCTTQQAADRCAVVFACHCAAILAQPRATHVGATIEQYQDAINRIPGSVRMEMGNPYWRWRMHGLDPAPGQTMGWTRDFSEVLAEIASGQEDRVLLDDVVDDPVPEPVPEVYRDPRFHEGDLEGPEPEFTWHHYFGPNYGPGSGSGSGPGGILKRRAVDGGGPSPSGNISTTPVARRGSDVDASL
ncbi:hypothetical protein TWF718_000060 [Orbilia javanica]|uniref:Uncharacterized protein n=1 Tax=Orbilia javanica TaxID=47235 RepID=A0AAN8N706_9PEZI